MSILSCPLSCNIMSLDLQYHIPRPAWFSITFFLMSLDMIGPGYLFSFGLPCFVSTLVPGFCDGAAHLGSKVGGVEHPFVSGILPVLLAYVYHTTRSPADSFLSPHAFDSVWQATIVLANNTMTERRHRNDHGMDWRMVYWNKR